MALITLSDDHSRYSEHVARRRRQMAVARNRQAHNGAPTDDISALVIDIVGAKGECAFYVWIKPMVPGIVWHAIRQNVTRLPDFDDWIDVKTRVQDWHSLIVQTDDPEEWTYVLACTSALPVVHLVGWIHGHEAKRFPVTDPAGGRPAHFVKRQHLNQDMAELARIISSRHVDMRAESRAK